MAPFITDSNAEEQPNGMGLRLHTRWRNCSGKPKQAVTEVGFGAPKRKGAPRGRASLFLCVCDALNGNKAKSMCTATPLSASGLGRDRTASDLTVQVHGGSGSAGQPGAQKHRRQEAPQRHLSQPGVTPTGQRPVSQRGPGQTPVWTGKDPAGLWSGPSLAPCLKGNEGEGPRQGIPPPPRCGHSYGPRRAWERPRFDGPFVLEFPSQPQAPRRGRGHHCLLEASPGRLEACGSSIIAWGAAGRLLQGHAEVTSGRCEPELKPRSDSLQVLWAPPTRRRRCSHTLTHPFTLTFTHPGPLTHRGLTPGHS